MAANNPVGVDDVFFSTTDEKGHIELANDVFVRLSQHSREELVGAPHNIIRNDFMPAGAFHAMWATLKAGKPFAAYVRNAAADGSPYDVLATVTPLRGGGYLSVRTCPLTASADTAWSLYEQIRGIEKERTAAGVKRAQMAEASAGHIVAALKELGLDSYEQFQNRIMPAEVLEREKQSQGLNPGSGEVATAIAAIHEKLGVWMDQQEALIATAEKIAESSAELAKEAGVGAQISEQMAQLDVEGPQSTLLLAPLRTWAGMHGIVDSYLDELQELADKLVESAHSTRFSIALARLHATVATKYATEVEGKGQTDGNAAKALKVLAMALEDGIQTMRDQLRSYDLLAGRLSKRLASVNRIMEPPREMISSWLQVTDISGFSDAARALVDSVAEAVEASNTATAAMQSAVEALENSVEDDAEAAQELSVMITKVVSAVA
ncbi:Aerotaxis receptor [Corynebacterium renale]|uniref:PAS domain-containing protein n=1 Tax=Corynebacterium renale TaxID=1724 RepID=UPI000DA357DB|nr:PAS domain-containing protein [Corynebacterium renale]SQG64100.1 Aerotaxis receptor [Corynebacterium renale]STC94326.1 Aerotaxis receptor [Corynebacterium renale]